jgi:SAM-dependent methyltransferase
VAAAVLGRRPKAEQHPRVDIPQLVGCQPLDQWVVPPLPQDRPLRVLELFSGVGSATQALVRLGYQVGEVVACEARGAARQVHKHALDALTQEFPEVVGARAGAQLHHRLPQDIRLVSRDDLHNLGPVDLVVAGWPCQGNSAAGEGWGLNDPRSALFSELLRVLSALQGLHKEWGQPLGYLIEHVAAGSDRQPRVRQHFDAVRGLLGPEVVFDAAQVGSRAHRLRAWWTNLEKMPLLRAAVAAQVRPAGLFVHQVLGPGRRARPPRAAGVAPWAKVETPGSPRRALNTFVSYRGSYAFSRGGRGVLACTQPNGQITFEEPTSEEGHGFSQAFHSSPRPLRSNQA